jgi:type II secretory pathway component PulF
MPIYAYKAKHGPQQTVEGELNAASRGDALAAVEGMGYSPVWIRLKTDRGARSRWQFARRIHGRDVTVFTRQLASLIRSGVPILRALRTIQGQTENRRMGQLVAELEVIIRDGGMLSDALSRYPALFPPLFLDMVRAGESGGVLDLTLTRLADAREKEEDVRRKVQAATAYPLLVVIVGVITVFVLLTFFLPQVVALFEDFEHLPLPTRILIGASNFFSRYWYWLALFMMLLVVVVKRLAAMERGRSLFDAVALGLPLIGRFVRESEIARFARTLALLIDAGVPIDKALTLGANTLRNAILREEVEAARVGTVQKGAPLSEGLRRARHFPAFVSNMTAVGEEGGRLDESLLEVAAFYEKEVDQQARLVTSLIEPALILVVGALVGFIVAAMLLPIFELGTGL